MIKTLTVTFDFDTETENVSNIKVVGNSEKKKTTTKKVKDVVTEMATEAIVTLETNKLMFNSKAVADMGLNYENRVVIKWISEGQGKKMIPIVGTDISFEEEGTGNKLTKSNTIAYRGKANTVLAELGNEFTIESYAEGIWKLVAITDGNVKIENPSNEILDELIAQAENVDADLLVDDENETEISKLTFKL